jgi:hypothetical protein
MRANLARSHSDFPCTEGVEKGMTQGELSIEGRNMKPTKRDNDSFVSLSFEEITSENRIQSCNSLIFKGEDRFHY